MSLRVLDLYCGAGGASYGIYLACIKHGVRCEIVGVDFMPQPSYPFKFLQADVLHLPIKFLKDFDFIWASPPCQAYSWAAKRWHKKYPDLIGETRKMLLDSNVPFVIENVVGSPLRKDLVLCGRMFKLKVIRHRIFEVEGFCVLQPFHPRCRGLIKKGLAYTVAGSGGNSKSCKLSVWKRAMGIDWMNKKELTQAVPPAYSMYIFEWFIRSVVYGRDENDGRSL